MADAQEFFDVVVVGGGPMGLSAAVSAARRGLSVAVLEDREFHGDHGGSGGAERQWRIQYAQENLARLTLEAHRAWQTWEEEAGRRLVHRTGSLWFGDAQESNSEGQINAAVSVLDRLGVPYEPLKTPEIEERYGFRGLPGHFEGFYQPDGGMIDVRATRWTLVEKATALGCRLRGQEGLRELLPDGGGVTLRTARGTLRAGHVIIAAGPFSAPLLAPLGIALRMRIHELGGAYFRRRDTRDYPTWFAFQNAVETDSNVFYGFGTAPWSGNNLVRVAPLFEQETLADAREARYTVRAHELRRTAEWVTRHLPSLDPEPLQAGTCLAALPEDENRQFYLGRADGLTPDGERITVVAGGWAFKFVPVFGEIAVDLMQHGRTDHDVAAFGLQPAESRAPLPDTNQNRPSGEMTR